MSRLKPPTEKLVEAGRTAFRPSDSDRERVRQALLPKLDGSAGAGTSVPSSPPAAAKATLVKSGAVLVGLGVAGAALFFALSPESETAPTAPPVAPATPAPASPVPDEGGPESAEAVTPPAPPTETGVTPSPRPADSRRADSLAQEVGLLSRASAELHGGRPQAALAALDEHQRKFPSGALAQERTAARVQALCALGRTNEARAELARLSRTSPNSPYEARARKACGSALTGER